jgi:hypothetical protein
MESWKVTDVYAEMPLESREQVMEIYGKSRLYKAK